MSQLIEALWKENLEKDAEYFENVQWLVDATDTERFFLWKENDDREHDKHRLDWCEVSRGWSFPIGRIGDRPVCVSVSYAILNGVKVMFYRSESQVTDYAMVQEWRKHHAGHLKHDGKRPNHCNAMNFHHCVEYCVENSCTHEWGEPSFLGVRNCKNCEAYRRRGE